MSATVLQHPRAAFVLAAPWLALSSTPGIAAPKLWVCTHCKLSLVLRARPVCVVCGQPMRIGK